MRIADSVVAITGASSGIGRALAVELGLRGARIMVGARSEKNLRETSFLLGGWGITHRTCVLDVTSEDAIEHFLQSTQDAFGRLDILVNNAGVGLFQGIVNSKLEDAEAVFRTNFWGPFLLMQRAARFLHGGLVINVSSAASKYAPVHQGIYAASKAALERVSEAVGMETQGLRTMVVVPDRTATPFMQNVLGPKAGARLGFNVGMATAEKVSRRIASAIESGAEVCYTTPKARIYALLSALMPSLVRRINLRMSMNSR